jgi:hypothetical protein
MKNLIFTLGCLAFLAMSPTASAQYLSDTDLPSWDTDSESKLHVTGDARIRNRFAADGIGESGAISPRFRINLGYEVNETTTAYIQWTGAETWSGSIAEGTVDANFGNGGDQNAITQAYFSTEDLLGMGATWTMGRRYYGIGSGMVIGSDEFLQSPNTFSGAWVNADIGGQSVEIFGINVDSTAARFIGLSTEFSLGDTNTISPWYLEGTGEGFFDNADSWLGMEASGAYSSFDWMLDWASKDSDLGDVDALRAGISMDMGDYTNGMVESISYGMTDSDGAVSIEAADFNSAGIAGFYGGAFSSELETQQIGIEFGFCDCLDLGMNFIEFGNDDGSIDDSEMDIMMGMDLSDNVRAFIGYGETDSDIKVGYLAMKTSF